MRRAGRWKSDQQSRTGGVEIRQTIRDRVTAKHKVTVCQKTEQTRYINSQYRGEPAPADYRQPKKLAGKMVISAYQKWSEQR